MLAIEVKNYYEDKDTEVTGIEEGRTMLRIQPNTFCNNISKAARNQRPP